MRWPPPQTGQWRGTPSSSSSWRCGPPAALGCPRRRPGCSALCPCKAWSWSAYSPSHSASSPTPNRQTDTCGPNGQANLLKILMERYKIGGKLHRGGWMQAEWLQKAYRRLCWLKAGQEQKVDERSCLMKGGWVQKVDRGLFWLIAGWLQKVDRGSCWLKVGWIQKVDRGLFWLIAGWLQKVDLGGQKEDHAGSKGGQRIMLVQSWIGWNGWWRIKLVEN